MERTYVKNALLLVLAALAGCDGNDVQTPSTIESPAAQQTLPVPASQPAQVQQHTVSRKIVSGPTVIDWDELVPEDWERIELIDQLMIEYDVEGASDDDPRMIALLERIKTLWKEAPLVNEYDGKLVKLWGYLVPVEMDSEVVRSFLLVPYWGACVHSPPPPANQTVYVTVLEKEGYEGKLFDMVWVTGEIAIERLSNELGDAGYRIDAQKVRPRV